MIVGGVTQVTQGLRFYNQQFGILRAALCLEGWYPMGHAAKRFSKMAYRLQLLAAMERTGSRTTECARGSLKK